MKSTYYHSQVEDLYKTDPQRWWKKTKEIIGKNKQGMNNFQGLANDICNANTNELATQINSFFQSVSANLEPLDLSKVMSHKGQIPSKFSITVQDVEKKLFNIKLNKSIGPDSIPNWILHDFIESLAKPICAIFNSSVREGYVPPMWKTANVCPIPKVNRPSNTSKIYATNRSYICPM